MEKINITRFDGGVSNDIRDETSNGFQLTRHFDIFTSPKKLSPYRSTEADTNDGSSATGMEQYEIKNFVYGSDLRLYGLGRQTSFSRPKIFYKGLVDSGNWTLPVTAQGSSGVVYGSFIEWGTTKALWMFSGATNVSKWTIDSTFTDTVATVGTITTVAQSVKAADDNMYMFYNNKVVRVTPGGTVTDAVLTLPASGRITSACNYGSYMAIAWVDGVLAGSVGRSYLYIWDLVSSDVSERVDWGDGVSSLVVGNLNGTIIGISDNWASNSLAFSGGRIYVKAYSGGNPQIIKEIKNISSVITGSLITIPIIKDNRMYWAMNVQLQGMTSVLSGIWAVGKNSAGNYVVTLDTIEEAMSNSFFTGFIMIADYTIMAYGGSGKITKTDDVANFSFTSIYDSQIFSTSKDTKWLREVWCTFEKLPSAGQVVMKYKKDEETSFTTLFTESTDNAVKHECVNIESTGAQLPQFREIQFRIESTGGAVITGFGFNQEKLQGLTK